MAWRCGKSQRAHRAGVTTTTSSATILSGGATATTCAAPNRLPKDLLGFAATTRAISIFTHAISITQAITTVTSVTQALSPYKHADATLTHQPVRCTVAFRGAMRCATLFCQHTPPRCTRCC